MKMMRTFPLVCALLVAAPLFAETKAAPSPATKPATRETLPPLLPGVVAHRDLKYAQGSPAQVLDIYLPEKVDQALPLVIYIHGGGWSGGDKKYFPAQVLVSQGYAVASINYRFIKEAIFPAQI